MGGVRTREGFFGGANVGRRESEKVERRESMKVGRWEEADAPRFWMLDVLFLIREKNGV